MKCPNCGTPEQARVKVCPSCGEAYASQDLLEESQLAFLVDETAGWDVPQALRAPYVERLTDLRTRLKRDQPVAPQAPLSEPAAPAIAVPAPEPVLPAAPQEVEAAPPAPPQERVPFDQWLLSERNIKIALYSGGLLLFVAGAIFIGVKWATIPGPVKFAITLMVTGLTYLGGYLLFQRLVFRLGGIALLGIASGFLTLNFAVLQIYVLGPRGLQNDVMWLIASPLCLLLYLLTTYWTRSDLFAYISLAAVGSTLAAALVVADAPLLAFVLAYALLFLGILVLAKALQQTPLAGFSYVPALIVSQAGMLAAVIAALVGWASETGCADCPRGSPWLALLAMGVGVLFFGMTDVLLHWLAARWAAAVLLPVTLAVVLTELNATATAIGIALMVLALAYMGLGYALERREGRRAGAWPLYAMAFVVALYVTSLSANRTTDLILALFGDVALLAVSAAIYRSRWWVYGAVWLLILPVYLIVDLYVPELHNRGLLMGLLGLNDAIAGYVLGRREVSEEKLPRRGGPFLTAAVFLSVVVVALAWGSPVIVSLLLAAVAALYLAGALWLGWPALLLPAVIAVGVGLLAGQEILLGYNALNVRVPVGAYRGGVEQRIAYATSSEAYAALAALLLLGGLGLRRRGEQRWAWPLYLTGTVGALGTFLAGLLFGWRFQMQWLAIGLSALLAVLALAFAWLERDALRGRTLSPLLVYLGLGAILAGHFYAIGLVEAHRAGDVWPAFTAGLCALFVALAWLLRRGPAAEIYAVPLRLAGLWLMAVPMVGAVVLLKPALGVVTFAIAAATYLAAAALRRDSLLAHLGVGALFAAHFYAIGWIAGGRGWDVWPGYTAGLCGLYVILAWFLRREPLDLFATPLRRAGLFLMAIPAMGAAELLDPTLGAVTCAIAGVTYLADAILRRILGLAYLSVGAFVIALCALLRAWDVSETQAYLIPVGLALLGVGWHERRRDHAAWYWVLTLLGLAVMMGSAFVQTLPRTAYLYAALLGIEGLVCLGWGVRKRSRGYVAAGVLALVVNAIAQFGLAFAEWPRWIQIGLTGAVLLGIGLVALFKRAEILQARQRLAKEWRQWAP